MYQSEGSKRPYVSTRERMRPLSFDGLGIASPGTPEYAKILALRGDFVAGMGWLKGVERENDIDRYDDETAGSLHFYTENYQGDLEASMRLTPVPAIDNCLSVEMLQQSPEALEGYRVHRDALDDACQRGNVWDLTRMVHPLDGSVDPEAIMAGMVKMIGAGIRASDDSPSTEPPMWIFTTTVAMERALNSLGIKHEILAGGRLSPDDHEESLFCAAKPLEALQYVQDNPDEHAFTLEHVNAGLQLRPYSV